ncbi:peptide chain release factor 1-like, mitochondrial [Galendromus occidentalis]|uniref:Peptide chain release factor 1-like, mitochondrial n=1 Tax=Galendromus occidentalis TaxID=34638 RepID=A0AAJ7PAR0_9ACAR|nr:peptide chain release factor 1-like, mitochondrial [Galendromus occidentalis]
MSVVRCAVKTAKMIRIRVRSFSSAANLDLDFRDSKVNAYLANIENFLANEAKTTRKISGINQQRLRTLSSIYGRASAVLNEIHNLEELCSEMRASDEKEMAEIAQKDIDVCVRKLKDLSNEDLIHLEQAWLYILPYELQDTDEILVEFSAGVGGQEAMLFNSDLFKMYSSYARNAGWGVNVVEFAESESGGLRSGTLHLCGANVGRHMKFESGVHRVQRTPKTERGGRIHTSTATVAVLACPAEIDDEIDPKDLIMKFKRAGGPGGQHVNKTESAVQILHTPSGIMVEADIERSQLMNKEAAMKKLRAKLFDLKVSKEANRVRSERKLQVGTAGRSEKIRTYNFAQDRVTDHRAGISVHNLQECLAGGSALSRLIEALQEAHRIETAQHLISNQLYY